MRAEEIQRLLVDVLPTRFFASDDDFEGPAIQETLATLYRDAYEVAPDHVKRQASESFVRVLREQSYWRVRAYEDNFFRGGDLEHITPLICPHALPETSPQHRSFLRALDGISRYLKIPDLHKFTNLMMRSIVYNRGDVSTRVRSAFIGEFNAYVPVDRKDQVRKTVDLWMPFLERRGLEAEAEVAKSVAAELDDDIPF
jgi:hypothetical protein